MLKIISNPRMQIEITILNHVAHRTLETNLNSDNIRC